MWTAPRRFVRTLLSSVSLALLSLAASGQTYRLQTVAISGAPILDNDPLGGGNLGAVTSLGRGPSINNGHKVAFIARSAGDVRLMLRSEASTLRNLRIFETASDHVQVNDLDQIAFHVSTNSGSLAGNTWVERYDSPTVLSPIIEAGPLFPANSPFSSVGPGLSVDNTQRVVGSARRKSDSSEVVFAEDGHIGPEADAESPPFLAVPGLALWPKAADDGKTVVQSLDPSSGDALGVFLDATFSSYGALASAQDFSLIGVRPGISDDGKVIAFLGIHNTAGPGLFVAYYSTGSASWHWAQLASLPNATGLDFSVGVNHAAGGAHWEYTVVYLLEEGNLRTLRKLDLSLLSPTQPATSNQLLIAREGAVLGQATVADLDAFDPVNDFGEIVFWMRDVTGVERIHALIPNTIEGTGEIRGVLAAESGPYGDFGSSRSPGAAVWAIGTNGSGAARLAMRDDADLVLETAAGVSVWSTSTGQSGGGGGGGTSAAVVHATKGGVNLTKSNISVGSPARSGDYEIVAVAGSSVQGGTNAPIDKALMTDQGFQLVGVRGQADRKSEVWIRKNNGSSGQASIRITGDGPDVLWSITTIDGSKSQLNLSSIQTANTFASHSSSSASFSAPGGSGLLFVAMMFDDPVEVLSAGSGSILYKTWGSGDGNGIASLLFQPGVSVPSSVNIKNYDSGGRQYAVVAARIAVTSLGGTADTTPPVITLNGSASMTVTVGSSFSDPGATATDNEDGTVSVNVTGSVNLSVVGTYTLEYNARDLAGNNATTETRTVNVINASGGGSGPGTSNLQTGQKLSASQFIVSANGAHKFVLQGTGNLVLYSSGQARWATATQGKGGTQLFLQGDGNLVLRTAAGAAVWSSGTHGKGAVRLVMQDDGNLVLLTAAGGLVWSTNTGDGGSAETTPPVITLNGAASVTVTKGGSFSDPGATATDNKDGNVSVNVTGSVNVAVVGTYTLLYDARDAAGNNAVTVTRTVSVVNPSGGSGPGTSSLQTGQRLRTNQFIESANGAYKFVLQGDGNLVLYTSARRVRWTATTQGKGGSRLILQGDGNLVLRDAAGSAVWSSGTHGKGVVRLVMQDDGNLMLQTAAGATLWSTNTGDSTP